MIILEFDQQTMNHTAYLSGQPVEFWTIRIARPRLGVYSRFG